MGAAAPTAVGRKFRLFICWLRLLFFAIYAAFNHHPIPQPT
jgi:hypothetical protein